MSEPVYDVPIWAHAALSALWSDAIKVDQGAMTIHQARQNWREGKYAGVPRELAGEVMG